MHNPMMLSTKLQAMNGPRRFTRSDSLAVTIVSRQANRPGGMNYVYTVVRFYAMISA